MPAVHIVCVMKTFGGVEVIVTGGGGRDGPQKRSGLGRREKSVAPAGMRNQNCPCRGLVTVLTELSRIH